METIGNAKLIKIQSVKIQKEIDYDCAVGGKVLILKDGILCKEESPEQPEPWTIKIVHTHGTIKVTRNTKSERINVRRVEPFFERNE